jgi:hypothetical protein
LHALHTVIIGGGHWLISINGHPTFDGRRLGQANQRHLINYFNVIKML